MKINFNTREKILNIATNWAILLVTLIICLLILEFCLSKYNAGHYFSFNGVDPTFNQHIKENLWVADSELGYVPGPAWIGKDGVCGCQNGKEYLNMEPSGKDILLIGDSLLQSRYLERAFKFFLKEPYRIWNAGIGGYNTLQEAMYLEKDIKIKPQVIIVGFCENDFMPSMTIVPRSKKMAYSLFEPVGEYNPTLFRYSALYKYSQIKKAQFRIKKYSSVEKVIADSFIVKQGFSKMKEYADKNGALLFCIMYPHFDEPTYDWQKKAREIVSAILEELDIKYLNLVDEFERTGFSKLKIDAQDNVHPNLYGHFLAARAFIDKFHKEIGITEDLYSRLKCNDYYAFKLSEMP